MIDKFAGITARRRRLLDEIAEALKLTVPFPFIHEESDLVTEEFSDEFCARLLVHHAMSEEKLTKKSFEYFLCETGRSCGIEASIASVADDAGADIQYNGESWSLKTEAAKNIRRERMTISKLMEVNAIRDNYPEQESRVTEIQRRLKEHADRYDRILVLRAHALAHPRCSIEYELVEIPKELLLAAAEKNLRASDVKHHNSKGFRAVVSDKHGHILDLVLDGSDEKVTIANLNVGRCLAHARWTIPVYCRLRREAE